MEVYPRGVQPVKGNHPGLIPISEKFTRKLQRNMNVSESDLNDNEASAEDWLGRRAEISTFVPREMRQIGAGSCSCL